MKYITLSIRYTNITKSVNMIKCIKSNFLLFKSLGAFFSELISFKALFFELMILKIIKRIGSKLIIVATTPAVFISPLFLDRDTPKNNVIANSIIEINAETIIFDIFFNVTVPFYNYIYFSFAFIIVFQTV